MPAPAMAAAAPAPAVTADVAAKQAACESREIRDIRTRLESLQAAPVETLAEEAPQAGKLQFVEVIGAG